MLCGYYAQGAGQSNLLFVKFTTHGNVLWTTLPNVPKQFNINNVFQLTDQSFVAVGASGNYGTPNYAVLRFDSTLTNILSFVEHQVESDTFFTNWQSVEDAYLSPDQASIISICADNTTGSNINSDSYVLKSDINGQLIWKKKIDNGQLDRARAVKLLADNTILVTGITNQDYWTTWGNMFLTKLDGNGEVLWQRFFDSTGIGAPLTGINLLERNNGDILITGNKLGGPKSNILLVLMDANGAEKNRLLLTRDEYEDSPNATVLLDNEIIAIAGWQDQFWLHKNLLVLLPFKLISSTRETIVDSPSFEVFPNPFHTGVTMQYDHQSKPPTPLTLEIYAHLGSLVYTGTISNSLNLQELPSGMYYFVLTDKALSKSFVRRVVKE